MVRPTTLKLHEFDDKSFIHGCYIPDHICDDAIKYFDEHPDRQTRGKIFNANNGIVVDDSRKKVWIFILIFYKKKIVGC